MKGLHFADELHKISDMLRCSEDSFLYSYSYLTEEDYKSTHDYIIEVMKKHYQDNNIKADVETYKEYI
jgi:hypothetical protein